jgi:16S rRNA (guanine527-N7)-methyltransferase
LSKPGSAGQLAERINAGIEALGQQPGQHPIDRYVSFLQLLTQWNKAYNLTAIRTPDAMVTHHVLDSLAVLPYLRGVHALDIGTGAGVPGFILALARPDMRWVLLDSRQKKIRFITQAIMELRVTNIETVCMRAKEYRPEALFTTVITRAFGSLHKFYANAKYLIVPEGILLAMKGGDIAGEIEELQGLKDAPVVQVHSLAVPGVEKARCLVEMGISQ